MKALLFLSLLALAACEAGQNSELASRTHNSVETFSGELVLLDPAAGFEEIKAYGRAEDELFAVRKLRLNFESQYDYEAVYKEGGRAWRQLAMMEDGFQAYQAEAYADGTLPTHLLRSQTENWIQTEISRLQLSPEQRAQFDQAWDLYCDAKVIEWAVHPLQNRHGFQNFPDPSLLCQSHYKDRAYFQGESCNSPENGAYTRCLWEEGVLKTQYFADGEKQAMLRPLLSEENLPELRRLLAYERGSFNDAAPAAFLKLYYEKKDSFLSISLEQKMDKAGCQRVIKAPGLLPLCQVFGQKPLAISPRAVLSSMEGISAQAKILSPLPVPEGRTVGTQELIRFLEGRLRDEHSEADRLLLVGVDGWVPPAPLFAGASKAFHDRIPQLKAEWYPVVYGQLDDEGKAELDARRADLAAFKADIQNVIGLRNSLIENEGRQQKILAGAAQSPRTAKAFLPFTVSKTVNSFFARLSLSFADLGQLRFEVCFDESSLEIRACYLPPSGIPDPNVFPLEISRGEEADQYKLSFALSDPVLQGFAFKARDAAQPGFFNDLSAGELSGRRFQLDLRLQGSLAFGNLRWEQGSGRASAIRL